jgi:lon-related putative ATP-dependent protease
MAAFRLAGVHAACGPESRQVEVVIGASMKKTAKALRSEELRRICDPARLGFASTDELTPIDTLIGQERALDAIRFGARIDQPGYNLFALGPQGSGRHTAVLSHLEKQAREAPTPNDWVYVHNFEASHKPLAMRLPAGTAAPFKSAMTDMVEDLRETIPAGFQSDEYRDKRQAIDAEFEEKQESAFDELRQKAESQSVGILRTPMGFALAPMRDGQVIKPDVFNVLPKHERETIQAKISELQNELAAILERLPGLERRRRERIRQLNAELIGQIVDGSIKTVADKFESIDAIQNRLVEIREDLVQNAELFLPHSDAETNLPGLPVAEGRPIDPRFNRYLVNVMVANDDDGDSKGAPLICEDHPSLANLVGRVEHLSQFGALVTDFTMIRPGALHRANGGYLVMDARKILGEMFAWEALKRALRSETVTIVSAAEQLSLVSTISLEPEPIPLKAKIVLIGERILYYLLSTLDPEFLDLFKVEVDFDEELPRTEENIGLYAQLIATIVKKHELRPFDAAGTARLIDEAVRLAEDAERLTLRVGRLADLMQEADYWAGEAGRKTVTAKDVACAYQEQIKRADRIRTRSLETINRGIVLIDTEGAKVGQVNGLSVLSIGKSTFGRPSRITARVRMGTGKVIDIERETKLGGPIHSKGVLILSSYLAAKFALDVPMSLWASLVFEQSYGGVEGDSASSAELYALLSALADVPIDQSFAVTGSVNQHGEVQAIGGVNQKIEGFFDVCNERGLTGKQGVLIPASNVQHLMLHPDVVDAAQAGQFHIYPVETVAQGLEILTGRPAGERAADGTFSADSINAAVEARMQQFASARQRFAEEKPDQDEKETAT